MSFQFHAGTTWAQIDQEFRRCGDLVIENIIEEADAQIRNYEDLEVEIERRENEIEALEEKNTELEAEIEKLEQDEDAEQTLMDFRDVLSAHLPFFTATTDADQLRHEFERMAELHVDEINRMAKLHAYEIDKLKKENDKMTNFQTAVADLITAQTQMTNAATTLLELAADAPDAQDEAKAEKPKAPAKTKAVAKAKVEPKKVETEPAEALTISQVQKPIIKIAKHIGRDEAKALIAEFTTGGEHDLKAVPENKFAELKAAAEQMLDKAEISEAA